MGVLGSGKSIQYIPSMVLGVYLQFVTAGVAEKVIDIMFLCQCCLLEGCCGRVVRDTTLSVGLSMDTITIMIRISQASLARTCMYRFQAH